MNFKTAKAKSDGAMIRCAYGGSKDVKFDEFVSAATAEGINVGAYAFSTWHYDKANGGNIDVARAKAISEVEKVIAILQGKGIKGYVALDLELEKGHTTSLSRLELTEIANLYMDKLSKAGYRPCLYCSISWVYDKMVINDIKYPLWVAYYYDGGFLNDSFPETKYGNLMRGIKDKIVMWQFTSKGAGKEYGATSTHIDLNHIYADFIIKDKRPASVQPKPQPQPQPQPSTAKTYTVQKGDTLYSIAKRNGILLSYLLRANSQIANPNLIRVGQRINIPEAKGSVYKPNAIKVGTKVRVKKGAKTYDGGKISSFVFSKTYTVDQLKGDRAVLDIKGICTPINIKDLGVM